MGSRVANAQAVEIREIQKRNELDALRSKDRVKGDETAQQMAEQFRRNALREIQHEVMSEWNKAANKLAASKKMENELEALRSKEREKGDKTAELMAKKFRRQRDQALLMHLLDDWLRHTKEAQKLVPVEFGLQADVLTVTQEDENALQAAYLKAKVDVALKEIARLESEKAILRMEVAHQRRRADYSVQRAGIVVHRASKVLYFRAVRFRRERTFLKFR